MSESTRILFFFFWGQINQMKILGEKFQEDSKGEALQKWLIHPISSLLAVDFKIQKSKQWSCCKHIYYLLKIGTTVMNHMKLLFFVSQIWSNIRSAGRGTGAVDQAKGKILNNMLGQNIPKSLNIKSLPTNVVYIKTVNSQAIRQCFLEAYPTRLCICVGEQQDVAWASRRESWRKRHRSSH